VIPLFLENVRSSFPGLDEKAAAFLLRKVDCTTVIMVRSSYDGHHSLNLIVWVKLGYKALTAFVVVLVLRPAS
jgi:hypothetical protein